VVTRGGHSISGRAADDAFETLVLKQSGQPDTYNNRA